MQKKQSSAGIFLFFLICLPVLLSAQCPEGMRSSKINFIKNGNFESKGFTFESEYDNALTLPDGMYPEATFAVTTEVGSLHSHFTTCGDHTSGKGKMLLVNGATASKIIWKQKVCVPTMSLLTFKIWASSLGGDPPSIALRINGKEIATSRDMYIGACDWLDVSGTFFTNAGDSSLNLEIVNLNLAAGGNDFILDDISLIACTPKSQKDLDCGSNPYYEPTKKQDSSLANMPTKIGEIIVLDKIQFQQSKYDLDTVAKQELDKIVQWLIANPKGKIQLLGHTSSEGNPDKNFILSQNRVEACKKYIVSKNIIPNRIAIHACGSTKPAYPNDTPENKRKNRRVELKILSK
jgi:outer membrane protein OmpA-like peptidoglycan-associated protein